MGWDVNVHVTLHMIMIMIMLMMMMMMMMMMKLVNSRQHLVVELTSFTNRNRACAVPGCRATLYIHSTLSWFKQWMVDNPSCACFN